MAYIGAALRTHTAFPTPGGDIRKYRITRYRRSKERSSEIKDGDAAPAECKRREQQAAYQTYVAAEWYQTSYSKQCVLRKLWRRLITRNKTIWFRMARTAA